MKVIPQKLPEVRLIEPQVFGDERGYFKETYHEARYHELGVSLRFVQDNVSLSRRGILRGMHLQHPHAQGKLVSVLEGEVFDVAVDLRVGSPRFGQWVGATLSAENHRQLWVPPGFAHGFCVTSERALFAYKCTDLYHPECEIGVAWDDPTIGVEWPVQSPQVSPRDAALPKLDSIDRSRLPVFGEGA